MNYIASIRNVDHAGRFSIPSNIRKRLGIKIGDYVDISADIYNKTIIIRKFKNSKSNDISRY